MEFAGSRLKNPRQWLSFITNGNRLYSRHVPHMTRHRAHCSPCISGSVSATKTLSSFITSLAILLGCSSAEKAVVPLGFGPLAKAEQAKSRTLRQESTDSKQHARASRFEAARQPNAPIPLEKTTHTSTFDSPSPAAPVGSGSPIALASKVSDWLGLWRGKDTTRYLIPSLPSQPMDDTNARIRVESTRNSQLKLILVDSSNEKDLCTLTAQLEGNTAKVDPGQPCFGAEEDDGNLSVRVRTGLGTLRDSTLTLDLTLDADVQTEQFRDTGTVEYHFEGKRT